MAEEHNEVLELARRCRALAERRKDKPWLTEMADRLEQAANPALPGWATRRVLISAITSHARSLLEAYVQYEDRSTTEHEME